MPRRWLATLFGSWDLWMGGILWGSGTHWLAIVLLVIGTGLIWAVWAANEKEN